MGDVFEVHQVGNLAQRLARVVEQGDQFEGGIELNPLRSRQSRHRAAHLREILWRNAKAVGIPAHLAFRKHLLLHQCEEAQEEACRKVRGLHLRQAMLADRPEVEEEDLHHPAQHFVLEGRLGLGQSGTKEGKIGLHQPQSLFIEGNGGIDADEDEQQIFDTINSLGVNLTTSELLKNYFFSRETVKEYEERWEAVFEKDDETKIYWDTEIETGRVKRALIDIFFDSYFQIFVQDKQYSISNEDKIMYARVDKLALSYQHFINKYCKGDKNKVLGPMKDYASCFMQTLRPDCCKQNTPAAFGIERLNIVIFGLKTSTLIPYVLYVAKNVFNEDERNKIYGILESYIMRRMIIHATTKNYNNLFTSLILNTVLDSDSLIARLKNNNDTTTYIPNDEELKDGFKKSKLVNLQSRGIIYLIESRERPEHSSTALLGFDNYSLEHLMPKKWRNNWPACETEEEANNRDSILLTLGNLAIIPQSLNAAIRDANWKIKKEGKGKKPGLDICAAGLITMYDVLQKEAWTEKDILDRAETLYNQAALLWSI